PTDSGVEPSAIAQARRLDDEYIAHPAPDGISQPGRLRIGGQRSPVRKYLPKHRASQRLVEERRDPRRVHDLERTASERNAWKTRREAISQRVIDVVATRSLCRNARRPRRHRHVLRG